MVSEQPENAGQESQSKKAAKKAAKEAAKASKVRIKCVLVIVYFIPFNIYIIQFLES